MTGAYPRAFDAAPNSSPGNRTAIWGHSAGEAVSSGLTWFLVAGAGARLSTDGKGRPGDVSHRKCARADINASRRARNR